MKKKVDKRKLLKKMDISFSKIVRALGVCEHCLSTQNLQCAHVLSKRHLQTRFDLENALCLCVRCHIYWAHKEPHEFVKWFDDKFGGELYDELRQRANKTGPFDYEKKYAELKDLESRL